MIMNKGKYLLYLFVSILLVQEGCSVKKSQPQEDEKKQPNILILFSDQHNKKVAGYEGHPDVMTPNLDKLANESFVFDRAYCTVGICAPSRSSLMTGIYPRTLGLLSNSETSKVMEEVVSMPSFLRKNGYKTYAFGKRHTKMAVDEGWDVKKSHICSESPEENYVDWIEEQGYGKEFAMDWSAEFGRGAKCSEEWEEKFPTADLGTRISSLPEGYTMEAYTALNTIEMINNHAETGEPFFCWATFYRPHQPYTPLKKYMDMYDVSEWGEGVNNGGSIKKPESLYEPKENLPPMMQSIRDGGNKVWNVDKAYADEQLFRNYIGAYYALVTEMDHYIGQIIETLEKTGLKDETIIIYTTDHGDFVGHHGMVEKAAAGQNVYEDILNIPLIIHYPGQSKGGKKQELVSQVDIMPTIIEILGLETTGFKHPVQGKSLHGMMQRDEPFERKYVISESWSQAAIITERHKLGIMLDPTEYKSRFDYRAFGDMFYIRQKDPLEVKNGINDEGNIKEINLLRSYYKEFEQQYSDLGKRQVVEAFENK